ncbi:MAG TPA: CBS domain-containing protein [Terriglobales bacterium]|nr:CBS domain-containing protein [Terriglobales bacterium]
MQRAKSQQIRHIQAMTIRTSVGPGFIQALRIVQIIGYVITAIGLVLSIAGYGVLCVGVAIFGAIAAALAHVLYDRWRPENQLRNFTLRTVMSPGFAVLNAHATIAAVARMLTTPTPPPCVVVMRDGRPAGLIVVEDLRLIPEPHWPYYNADCIMQPITQMNSAEVRDSVRDVLALMRRSRRTHLQVFAHGRFVGIVRLVEIEGLLREKLATSGKLSMPEDLPTEKAA